MRPIVKVGEAGDKRKGNRKKMVRVSLGRAMVDTLKCQAAIHVGTLCVRGSELERKRVVEKSC